ncbi:MAG: succinate-semialdehyde dehydrogenase [Candidatus Sericytochromatia bacterium]|nr:MAG: succinate-semialdehyde dehydrogenase [Candidatus Sericytochromatia bacterium]
MKFYSINPSTEEEVRSYNLMSKEEISNIIDNLYERFLFWKKQDFSYKSNLVKNLSKLLKNNKENYARLMAVEMGKPMSQGIAEIEKCSWLCEYYADNSENFLKDLHIKTNAKESFVSFSPLGTILSIMPWNFPFWQVFRFAIPSLIVGNTVLLKHAPNVLGCSLKIEKLFLEAGFPENTFKSIIVDIDLIEYLLSNDKIQAVTLTGSTKAGKAVAQLAGKYIKKSVLELGGNDPYIILDDADLNLAVESCVNSRLINSGQSCISAKRFIIVNSLKKDFEELFIEKMSKKTFGNPLEGNFDLGPIARKDLRDNLHYQVSRAIKDGAKLLLGGYIPNQKGYFYPPTILTDVSEDNFIFKEETFGPVASIISAKDEKEAIKIANNSHYGLGAAIFTKDEEKAKYLAKNELNAGSCFINTFVVSDPRLPFGGIKESGYGRELSHFGLLEFVNIKTIFVK